MSMTEEFQKRQAEKPDKWTLAWWNQQFQEVLQGYRGATHAINRALAELEDAAKLRERIEALEAAAEADRAKIGELQARVERHAEFLTQLKPKKAT